LIDDFVRGGLPARDWWRVETLSTGTLGKLYLNIVIRHRLGYPSVVKASSRDNERIESMRQQVLADLALMTCYEFERKYGLKPHTSRVA
jgi:hypothetical protein